MKLVLMALSFLVSAGRANTGSAEQSPTQISALCSVGIAGGAARIELIATNGGPTTVFDVNPGAPTGGGSGTAVLFVESSPRRLTTLAVGAEASFVWSGRTFGDGVISVGTSLTARNEDGSEVRIEPIDCGDLEINDTGPAERTPDRTPHPHRTQIPTPIVSRTPTPVPTDLERCAGDCDGSGDVRLHELVTAIEIALGREEFAACRAADANSDSQVGVEDLTAVVRASLFSCAKPPTPTRTRK